MKKQIIFIVVFCLIVFVLLASNVFCCVKIKRLENELKKFEKLRSSAVRKEELSKAVESEIMVYYNNLLENLKDINLEMVRDREEYAREFKRIYNMLRIHEETLSALSR